MKWIKTSDRTPEIDRLVLVWLGNYPDLMYFNGEMFQSGCSVRPIDRVSHWAEVGKPE